MVEADYFSLEEIERLPPELLAEMRLVRKGLDDPNNESHRLLRRLMQESPRRFLEQMNGLEKAYQGQIGRSRAGRSITPVVPTEGSVVKEDLDDVDDKIGNEIDRLMEEWRAGQ